MIEHDCRDPVLIVRPPCLDAVVSEATGDICVRNGQPGLWIDDRPASRWIDLVASDDAVSRKPFCLAEIDRRLPRHSDCANLDHGEEHCRAITAKHRLGVAGNE